LVASHFRNVQGVGDGFELLEWPFPEWTITASNRIFYDGDAAENDLVALSECPALAGVWRDGLYARSGRG
jgi:MOSC domain-containing protein YiiM